MQPFKIDGIKIHHQIAFRAKLRLKEHWEKLVIYILKCLISV